MAVSGSEIMDAYLTTFIDEEIVDVKKIQVVENFDIRYDSYNDDGESRQEIKEIIIREDNYLWDRCEKWIDKNLENISLKTENQKLQERIKELEKDYKELEDKYEILYAHQADY